MPTLPIYRLQIKSPLHISNIRQDYDQSQKVLHSDTLYAAVMHAWAVLGRPEWINEFVEQEIPVTISSLFPYCPNEKEFVYFFPKPFAMPRLNINDVSLVKKLKKATWLDLDAFNKVLFWESNDLNSADIKGRYLSCHLPSDKEDFICSDVSPRILRPRNEAEDTKIFYMERLYFKYDSGLYFIMHSEDERWLDRWEKALTYLQDAGLGTDRTVGNGAFIWSKGSISLKLPTTSQYVFNLSLFCPESSSMLKELLDEHARYDLMKRGGWISEPYNTYRKRSVYMLRECSMLKYCSETITSRGKALNLAPSNEMLPSTKPVSHPIWRVGKSIFLPVDYPAL